MAKRERISLPDITVAFRALANEHARKREAGERSLTWRLIQNRLGAREVAEPWHAAPANWLLRVGVPVAAAAALTLGVVALRERAELHYEVRGAALVDGAIHTEAHNAVIDFSDGSRVEMSKGTTSQIEIAGNHAARTRLTAGDMEVSVHHAQDTDYRFLAGPYEVRVVGTKFHLSWQPRTGQFSVEMREGRVRVLGPGALDRAVSAGETLSLSGVDQALASREPEPAAGEAVSAHAGVRAPSRSSEPPAHHGAPSAAEGTSPAHGRAVASALGDNEMRTPQALAKADSTAWPALVAKGRFAEVVSAAEGFGTERALRERSGADLSALAHAANYTGRTALAVSAWTALRERFAGQKAARQSAFFIGRVYDQQGRAAEALRWLNAYLSEASGDVYASEALGRKLAVVQKLQGPGPARAVAQDYLARFPKGAYAQTARALLAD
ncbi:MAG TPA: FecR domain-containing protein [Polyangiaceae bacterium]|nr:FecR domain-containing protein [Polyangiaceae bacterium]